MSVISKNPLLSNPLLPKTSVRYFELFKRKISIWVLEIPKF